MLSNPEGLFLFPFSTLSFAHFFTSSVPDAETKKNMKTTYDLVLTVSNELMAALRILKQKEKKSIPMGRERAGVSSSFLSSFLLPFSFSIFFNSHENISTRTSISAHKRGGPKALTSFPRTQKKPTQKKRKHQC